MTQLYVIKNKDNRIVGHPSADFDALWDNISVYEAKRPDGSPYVIDKFNGKVIEDDFPLDESLADKPKKRNKEVIRKYFINDEEQKRDDFYDELVIAEPSDEMMLKLENDPKGIVLQGETFRIEKDREEEEEKEDTNEDVENPYVSSALKESLEDGVVNMVTFQNTNTKFFDSIDYFDEDEAQAKADELVSNPGKYSSIKIVRMKKNNQKKFLQSEEEQDDFLENGNIPEKYIEDETAVEEETIEDEPVEETTEEVPDDEVIIDDKETTEDESPSTDDDLSAEDVEKAKEVIDKLATKVEDKEEEETKEEDNLEG